MGQERGSGVLRHDAPPAPILRDPLREIELSEEGYARSPFLSLAEVERLIALHDSLHPAPGSGFDTDFAYVAPHHKAAVDRGIRDVVEPVIGRIFGDVQLFNVTFVVKWPGADSALPLHQDWAYVDERVGRACTLWVPLDATSPSLENGPLGLLPRSHLLPAHRRGANSVSWYAPYRDALSAHLHYPDVDVGDALVFDNRVLHGSPSNRTDSPRRAITLMVAHRDAQLVYHHVNGSRWETYEIGTDFFVRHGPMDLRSEAPPNARLIEVVDLDPPEAPLAELRATCGVDLEPRGVAEPVQLTGDPLGSAEPLGMQAESRIGSMLHRRISRRRSGPFFSSAELPVLRSLADDRQAIAAAWRSTLVRDGELPSVDMETRFGRWTAASFAEDGLGMLAELRALLRSRFSPDAMWLLRAGPHSELVARRTGNTARAMVFLPLDSTQPSGSCVLQVGTDLRPLEPYRPLAFDPTWEHTAWNLGAEDFPILCGWTTAPMRRAQRLAVGVLSARGTIPEPSPLTS